MMKRRSRRRIKRGRGCRGKKRMRKERERMGCSKVSLSFFLHLHCLNFGQKIHQFATLVRARVPL
jgi:hypothetical protein